MLQVAIICVEVVNAQLKAFPAPAKPQTSPAVTAVPSKSHAVNPTKRYAGNSPGFNFSVTLFGSYTLTFVTAATTIVKGEILKSATSSQGTGTGTAHLIQLLRTLPFSFASRTNV